MLAIETLLGALTGYFTNDIAIRQLFSKNGMVVREREQFTSLIVQVLRDDVINAETIDMLCDRPEMVSFFEGFIQILLNETIPQALHGKCLMDYDINGALQGIVKGRIADSLMANVALDVPFTYESIGACLQNDDFKQALLQCIQNLSALSLDDLGFGYILEDAFELFEKMNEDDWLTWLENKQCQLIELIAVGDVCAEDVSSELVKDLLAMDGETFVNKIEMCFGVNLFEPEQVLQFKVRYTQFLEQLYVFTARVLPQVLEKNISTFLEAFYPILRADKGWIEQMILDSVEACNTDGNMILSMAAGYIQNFFAPDESGKDWLEKIYDALCQDEKKSVLCANIADFVCGLVMKQIDDWRHLDIEDENCIKKVQEQYLVGRTIAVKIADFYLGMPAYGNPVHRVMIQGLISCLLLWLRQFVSVAKMQEWMKACKDDLASRSFEALFLNKSRQENIVDALYQWWYEDGQSWLKARGFNGNTMKQCLYQVIDWIFSTPLNYFVEYTKRWIPYTQLADALRVSFFSNLREFLAALTREQLDGLSHEEIREVVLDMIGREMRPLAYLGGGIGAVAGVATGAAMQTSGVSVDPSQVQLLLATRSGLYGAVGYGTNVMAVKGLFWPYKKTLGLQGLISKNQSRFANKMKNMAESYIMNDGIWMQQVERISKQIDQHSSDILCYGLHLMKENRENIINDIVKTSVHRLPYQISEQLFKENQIANLMKRFSDKGIQACFSRELVGNLAVHLQLFHQGICYLAMAEANNHVLSKKIVDKVGVLTPEDWMIIGNAMLKRCKFTKERLLYEKGWQYILPEYQKLPNSLLPYAPDIASRIDQYVIKKLSFPLQLGYRMAGGGRQIERVVTYVIKQQLPKYLLEREEVVKSQGIAWVMTQVAGRSIAECGVSISEAQGRWMADCMQEMNGEKLHQRMLSFFVCVEKCPTAYTRMLVKEAVAIVEPVFEVCSQYLREKSICNRINWCVLAHTLAPVLAILPDEVYSKVRVNQIFSVSENDIQLWYSELLHLSEVEKYRLIASGQKVWCDVAPSVWQAIGQHGRVLMMMVDVPHLTHDRICALSPQELEVMVRDIAQPYFTRVERMGWLGAVVAIPATIISMLLGGM